MGVVFLAALLVFSACSRGKKETVVHREEWADELRDRIDKDIEDPQKRIVYWTWLNKIEIYSRNCFVK